MGYAGDEEGEWLWGAESDEAAGAGVSGVESWRIVGVRRA